MAYRSGYARRRAAAVTPGRVSKPNRRAGDCRSCGAEVPAYGGELWRERDGSWSVVHVPERQGGWLMDPQPVTGGCPDSTDRRNAELHAAGFFGPSAEMPRPEGERIAERAALAAARMTMSSRRCEDAPCCGCCD